VSVLVPDWLYWTWRKWCW